MTEILAATLIFLSVALAALLLVILAITCCICSVAYTIWVERTGAKAAPSIIRKQLAKEQQEDIPDNLQWVRDPETGDARLMPSEEVQRLYQEMLDEEESIEFAKLDAWIDGKVPSGSKPR